MNAASHAYNMKCVCVYHTFLLFEYLLSTMFAMCKNDTKTWWWWVRNDDDNHGRTLIHLSSSEDRTIRRESMNKKKGNIRKILFFNSKSCPKLWRRRRRGKTCQWWLYSDNRYNNILSMWLKYSLSPSF